MATFAIGCAVLIVILSVFNGLHGVIEGMFNEFNSDLRVISSDSKTLQVDDEDLIAILERDEVKMMTPYLQETAVLYNDRSKVVATLKGVDPLFFENSSIGELSSEKKLTGDQIIIGRDLLYTLGINEDDPFATIEVFLANRKYKPLPGKQPIKKKTLQYGGNFLTNAEFDASHAFVPLALMQSLLSRQHEYNGLDIELLDQKKGEKTIRPFLRDLFSDKNVLIQNSYEQEESYFKLLRMEKMIAYVITIFVLFLILFNLMACLWMIVMEKERDLSILRSMGLTKNRIRSIFFQLGVYYCLIGGGVGILIGSLVVLLQKNFGLVRMGANYVVDFFPVELKWSDMIVVLISVILLGWIASLPAAFRASRTETRFSYD